MKSTFYNENRGPMKHSKVCVWCGGVISNGEDSYEVVDYSTMNYMYLHGDCHHEAGENCGFDNEKLYEKSKEK